MTRAVLRLELLRGIQLQGKNKATTGQQLGLGEVDVVICELSRKDLVTTEGWTVVVFYVYYLQPGTVASI